MKLKSVYSEVYYIPDLKAWSQTYNNVGWQIWWKVKLKVYSKVQPFDLKRSKNEIETH